MKQSPDKTDFGDARMLADLQRVGYLPRVWLAPEEVRELRRLVHYRQSLTKERKNLKLQIGATLREARQKAPENANPWTKAWLGWLESSAQLSPNARHITTRRGKPTGLIVAAVANRWVRWLFHQVQPSCLAA